MKGQRRIPPQGELRQSQVITTFGPGAMVDLPDHSVLIGGLEFWQGERRRLYDERLESRVCELLHIDTVALFEPPVDDSTPGAPRTGITSFVFPEWFIAQVEESYVTPSGKKYRTRPLVHWSGRVKGGYLTPQRKIAPVVPVRFVQACVKGHISDIDWYAFVHNDRQARRVGQLWLDEGGAGNDFSEIFIRCEKTGKRRPLSDATVPQSKVLGRCKGRQPWLGPKMSEACEEYNRLLVRSASNAYFGQTLSVIAIPDQDAALKEAVDHVYDDFLQYCESLRDVTRERRKQKVAVALEGFSDEAVWAELSRRNEPTPTRKKSIKQVEIETLLSQRESVGEDTPHGDFYARTRSMEGVPRGLAPLLGRIVLVHRMREILAQVGFTRFEASMPDIDGELDLDIELAPLARELSWVPAVENKGEGIFLSFEEQAIQAWLDRGPVRRRGRELEDGFNRWCERKHIEDASFPGLPYIMLHSLAHLLITAVSLECGYAASSIRERVYGRSYGYGILLYTGTAGSEGTLGGLVQIGNSIEHHLVRALEMGRLCSNDPVCAQHSPASFHEERFLHGAACHGCLLIAETCCERRNEFLDRALVVPTVSTPGAAFFPDSCF